jgi:diguanylate cyclase (GGDEF)-like protein
MRWIRAVREYFAPREDPYAGGDLANAQRIGAFLWGLVVALVVGLWTLTPPTDAIGSAGWIVAGAIAAASFALLYALWTRQLLVSWRSLLVASYVGVVGIAIMQWLAGGVGAPYDRLFLLPLGYVAAIQPSRRIAAFVGFVFLALAAPFVYDGWNATAAGSTGAAFVIWCAFAVVINVLMTGVRAQRLAHAREEAEAREEARHDSLTGLYNRRAFEEMLPVEVERSRRLDVPLSVAMIDIDNFKEVNDRWGYVEGDRCLRSFAEALGSSVRQPDICFRWGGDEFAVILTGTSAEEADPLSDRLRGAVAEACQRPDDEPITIQFALAELREGVAARELAEMAGMALISARMGAER